MFPETLEHVWPQMVRRNIAGEMGWLDPGAVMAAYDSMQTNYQRSSDYFKDMWWLWMAYSVNTWAGVAIGRDVR